MSRVKLCYSVCHLFTRKLGRAVANPYVGMSKAFFGFLCFSGVQNTVETCIEMISISPRKYLM